ncbi:MAG: hypothetical protein BWX80_00773 [Candidatus Hydrogenedentes bacterium ADurb.Bin101]|nr:MAG: hypothetical protein BWX80_00773 [Candidatus Hydrogenedentes bacterium ADurb.Bin101]
MMRMVTAISTLRNGMTGIGTVYRTPGNGLTLMVTAFWTPLNGTMRTWMACRRRGKRGIATVTVR